MAKFETISEYLNSDETPSVKRFVDSATQTLLKLLCKDLQPLNQENLKRCITSKLLNESHRVGVMCDNDSKYVDWDVVMDIIKDSIAKKKYETITDFLQSDETPSVERFVNSATQTLLKLLCKDLQPLNQENLKRCITSKLLNESHRVGVMCDNDSKYVDWDVVMDIIKDSIAKKKYETITDFLQSDETPSVERFVDSATQTLLKLLCKDLQPLNQENLKRCITSKLLNESHRVGVMCDNDSKYVDWDVVMDIIKDSIAIKKLIDTNKQTARNMQENATNSYSNTIRKFENSYYSAYSNSDVSGCTAENTNDSSDSYYPNEKSSSDEEYILVKKQTTTRRYDFLVSSNENDKIEVSDLNTRWVLKSGFDLSDALVFRRNQIIDDCEKTKRKLSEDEDLLLNGVVLIDEDSTSNIIEGDYYNEACNEMKHQYAKYKEKEDEVLLHDLLIFAKHFVDGNSNKAKDYVNSCQDLSDDIKQVLYSTCRTYCSGYSLNDLNESTLVKDCVLPFFEPFFVNNKKYKTLGADLKVETSGNRFAEIDPSLKNHIKKADYSIASGRGNYQILSMEAKQVRCKNKSKGDLIKMAKYMKDTLQAIEEEDFRDVSIIGIIVSGADVSIYTMNHAFDYLFNFFKLATFHIPLDNYDMFRVINIIPTIMCIKNIVTETSNELSKLPHNREAKNNKLKSIYTYHSPVEIPSNRIKRVNLDPEFVESARRKLRFQ